MDGVFVTGRAFQALARFGVVPLSVPSEDPWQGVAPCALRAAMGATTRRGLGVGLRFGIQCFGDVSGKPFTLFFGCALCSVHLFADL